MMPSAQTMRYRTCGRCPCSSAGSSPTATRARSFHPFVLKSCHATKLSSTTTTTPPPQRAGKGRPCKTPATNASSFGSASSTSAGVRDVLVGDAIPSMKAVREIIGGFVHEYLQTIAGGAEQQQGELNVFYWAGVHNACEGHMPHIHERSVVSGTFYISTPPGAGDLVLADPRGRLPPFGQRLVVRPTPGLLVLFPPWLVHFVTATCAGTATTGGGDDAGPRIAISFNVVGDDNTAWQATSGASLVVKQFAEIR